MKAIVQDRYGSVDVFQLREIDVPVPKADEVLVRVRATSLHPDVWHAMRGVPSILRLMGSGLRRPKNPVPGTDVAGVVETVGTDVTRFHPGDEVFGPTLGANLWGNGGSFAEYAAVSETKLQRKPADLTFEQAASVLTSGPIAVQGVRDEGRVRPGQKVLINGAGGGVGTIAVQLAKAYGADVTAVDAAGKLELLRSIGADRVIDYAAEDFTRTLTPEGSYVLIGHDQYGASGHRWVGSLGRFFRLMVIAPFVRQLHPFRGAKDPGDRLTVLTELIEAGRIVPVIDRMFRLAEVPEAIRYLESGRVQGKIVITI